MGYTYQNALPATEPVSLVELKQRLNFPLTRSDQDQIFTELIQSAREDGERLSGLALAQRQFTQVLDSFPYYTDTVQGQQAYPPSYYSLPRYSTTLWNYSQMIKLEKAPLISVDTLTYIDATGNSKTLASGTDFIVDPETRMARIFPMVGQYWPAVLYTPNAVQIVFTAGFDPDPTATKTFSIPAPAPNPPNQQSQYVVGIGIPQNLRHAIINLAAFRYQNVGTLAIPDAIERAFQANGVGDLFAPTRG